MLISDRIQLLRRMIPLGVSQYFKLFGLLGSKTVADTETTNEVSESEVDTAALESSNDPLAIAKYMGEVKRAKDKSNPKKKAKSESKETPSGPPSSAASRPDKKSRDNGLSETPSDETEKPNYAGEPVAPYSMVRPIEAPKSHEDWARLILQNGDYRNVVEFIRLYQVGDISAETFYKVVRVGSLCPAATRRSVYYKLQTLYC